MNEPEQGWTAESLQASEIWAQKDWYHQIEILPGLLTPGKKRPNLVPVRQLLQQCDLSGASCVDIGARDGLMSVLMLRKGAERVTTYDRFSYLDHIRVVRDCLGVEFEYLHSLPLTELKERMRSEDRFPADFALCAGVFYHLPDLVGGLANVRSLVRSGGLVLLETITTLENDERMHFNAAARFTPSTTYWLPSAATFESLTRLLGMQPIDCRYISTITEVESGRSQARVAILCRAMDGSQGAGHPAPRAAAIEHTWEEYGLDLRELRSKRKPVPCSVRTQGLVHRDGGLSIDVFRSLCAVGPCNARQTEFTFLPLGAHD